MIQPPPLKAGDKVGIISTARKISKAELEPALEQLQQWGLEVVNGQNLHKKRHQLAGTPKQRLNDLQKFIDDPEVKAIFCARGGYGTVQIIDMVNFFKMVENPTWLIGYSDITVLHNKLARLGFESIHASMPINFAGNTTESLESLRCALFGEPYQIAAKAHDFNRLGTAEARVTGGNLSMIYSQCGSDSALETEDKILFLEDLDEYLYHIDRMLYNLKRNAYFEKLKGVIIGGMTDMNDNEIPFGETAEDILNRHFSGYNFPVAFGFPAGHLPDNRALIFGRKARLEINESGTTLTFDHGTTQ